MTKEVENWSNWVLRLVIVGISSFAVSYLRDIGRETAALSNQFLELKYEIKRLAENQVDINSNFARQLERLEKRVTDLELEDIENDRYSRK